MKKILFLIHDLGQGGAEKVLVNLVNHMDHSRFSVTVLALFGGGVNEQFLSTKVRYLTVFPFMIPGNTKWMKLLSPRQWHKLIVREHYDIEISYLEGPSARIISGCDSKNTKLVSWIHVQQYTAAKASRWFRNHDEAVRCYNAFHQTICVSQQVKKDFCDIFNFSKPCKVLYNTVDSQAIRQLSTEAAPELDGHTEPKLIVVGSLKPSKGLDRLLRIASDLRHEGKRFHLFILGKGPSEDSLREFVNKHDLSTTVTFLGYHTNPYKFVAKCDLLICSSYAEGFSTAATEALIVGTPVCTVDVSGMKEMLGESNEYGLITENNESALYEGIKALLDSPTLLDQYKKSAAQRGNYFSTAETVAATEDMLLNL